MSLTVGFSGLKSGRVVIAALLLSAVGAHAQGVNFVFKDGKQDGVVATVGGQPINDAELSKNIESKLGDLKQQEYDLKMTELEHLVFSRLLEEEAKKKNMSPDEYLAKKIYGSISAPSDKAIEAFLIGKGVPKERINPPLQERARGALKQEAEDSARATFLAKQTKGKPVEVYLREPAGVVIDVGNSPFSGSATSKAVLTLFSDFQCPYCGKAKLLLDSVKKEFGNKVKIVFKNFPLVAIHPFALPAAEATMCAREQDMKKFWKMHDLIFDKQSNLSQPNFLQEQAEKAGVDKKLYAECLAQKKSAPSVAADVKLAESLDVRSTPTLFLNGKKLAAGVAFDALKVKIEKALR